MSSEYKSITELLKGQYGKETPQSDFEAIASRGKHRMIQFN